MDIFNNSVRQLICVNNESIDFGHREDPSWLMIGGHYTFKRADIYSGHTMVTLFEFPGKRFNSIHFKEVD